MTVIRNSRWRGEGGGAFVKRVFLKISQNLQENNGARVSYLIKLQALVKFLRKAFSQYVLGWLLLYFYEILTEQFNNVI